MKKCIALLLMFLIGIAFLSMPQASEAKEKLVFWGKQALDRNTDDLISKIVTTWGEKNDVEVEYITVTSEVQKEKYAAAFETHTAPDIIMMDADFCKFYASKGVLRPVDEFYEELKTRAGGMFEGVLPILKYEDALYGIPFQNDIYFFYVRKDLVEGVGETLPQTWEDVARVSLKIKDQYKIAPFGHPLNEINDNEYSLRIMMWAFGAYAFDEEGKVVFNRPESVALFNFIKKMYEDGTIPRGATTWDDAGNNKAYQTQQAAFIINPGSVYHWMVGNAPELLENSAITRMPAGPGGQRSNLTTCWSVSITQDAKNPELAKELLRDFYLPEHYNQIIESAGGRFLPVYKDLFETDFWKGNAKLSELPGMLEDAKVIGHPGPVTTAASEILVQRVISNALLEVLVKGMSAEDAVAMAAEKMQQIVDSMK